VVDFEVDVYITFVVALVNEIGARALCGFFNTNPTFLQT
jgi:hypothetical protein